MRVYDVASIGNKGVSQKIISAPFSPFGQDTNVPSKNATCVVLPTTQPVHPARNTGDLMRVNNLEQPFAPIYNYALITDAEEGLILTDINTLADGEFRNNFLNRALTWNPGGVLNGARHLAIGGNYVYIATPTALVVADLSEPLKPVVVANLPMNDLRSVALQFRYLFAVDAGGLQVIDITHPGEAEDRAGRTRAAAGRAQAVRRAHVRVRRGGQGRAGDHRRRARREAEALRDVQRRAAHLNDARDVVVATTNASLFAYVADGKNGLKVVQLTSPESQPRFYGFSPDPKPELIAWYRTSDPALSLSRPLERDRAVDETGGQVAVFGRRGARPFTMPEMQSLFLNEKGEPWFVEDEPSAPRP